MSDICIKDYLNNYDGGKYDSSDVSVQCDAGWYDWFCKDTSLQRKTVALTRKLRQLIPVSYTHLTLPTILRE